MYTLHGVGILHSANNLDKIMNPTILRPAMLKNCRADSTHYIYTATDLR